MLAGASHVDRGYGAQAVGHRKGELMGQRRSGSVERRSGLYSLLEGAAPYALLQRALGATRVREVLVERFVQPMPGMHILDVGAGTGALRPFLRGCQYTAIEPNERYVAVMRAAFAGGDDEVVLGTTAALANMDGPFDRVIMAALLHHLSDEAAGEAFRDAAALLAPGGRLITFDPCFHAGQSASARWLASMDRGANVRDVRGYGQLADPWFRSVRTYLSCGLLRVPYSHAWLVCEQPRV
jgi:SAM-dependent methyltransferase